MHINPDMLEGVHLTSAMLHEVPNMAQYGAGNKRRQMSKTFRRLYDYHTKQAFNGMACLRLVDVVLNALA